MGEVRHWWAHNALITACYLSGRTQEPKDSSTLFLVVLTQPIALLLYFMSIGFGLVTYVKSR